MYQTWLLAFARLNIFFFSHQFNWNACAAMQLKEYLKFHALKHLKTNDMQSRFSTWEVHFLSFSTMKGIAFFTSTEIYIIPGKHSYLWTKTYIIYSYFLPRLIRVNSRYQYSMNQFGFDLLLIFSNIIKLDWLV